MIESAGEWHHLGLLGSSLAGQGKMLYSDPHSRVFQDAVPSSTLSDHPQEIAFLHACSVAQSCPILCDPMDYSLPGFSVHGVFQARILGWVATAACPRMCMHPKSKIKTIELVKCKIPTLLARMIYICLYNLLNINCAISMITQMSSVLSYLHSK